MMHEERHGRGHVGSGGAAEQLDFEANYEVDGDTVVVRHEGVDSRDDLEKVVVWQRRDGSEPSSCPLVGAGTWWSSGTTSRPRSG